VGGHQARDGGGHVRQQERVGEILEARREEVFDVGRLAEAAVQEALREQRRDRQRRRELSPRAAAARAQGSSGISFGPALRGPLLAPRGGDGEQDGGGDDRGDDEQRDAGLDFDLEPPVCFAVRGEEHFAADEDQHDGQADLEVAEILDGAGQHENTASAGRGWQRRSR